MGDSRVSSARGAWMRREGFSSAVHYFPAGEDTSTCGLMSVDGRWRWGRGRRSKHGVYPATKIMDDVTMCVLRVAVIEGNKNACSMLYGAASRMAKASGADNLVTYTLPDEPGTSLRASGWIPDGMTAGGDHGRPCRPRDPAVDPRPKQRWWAPWSRRIARADGLLPGVRDLDNPCDMFSPGTPTDGGCEGDGHYLCRQCVLFEEHP